MIAHFLANTPPPDTMVSGNWIIGLIGAIAAGIALVLGKKQGIKEATNNITLQSPMPEVPVRKVPGTVSWYDHSTLAERVGRLENHIDSLRREQADQFKDLLESGSVREVRIMEKIDAVAREWHARMDTQFGPKPRGGAR